VEVVMRDISEHGVLDCAFCGKGNDDVAFMITGPNVQICCECVVLAHGMVLEKLLSCAMPSGKRMRKIARRMPPSTKETQ
jgi:ATP-dependent protease Clp ATPase subunit